MYDERRTVVVIETYIDWLRTLVVRDLHEAGIDVSVAPKIECRLNKPSLLLLDSNPEKPL